MKKLKIMRDMNIVQLLAIILGLIFVLFVLNFFFKSPVPIIMLLMSLVFFVMFLVGIVEFFVKKRKNRMIIFGVALVFIILLHIFDAFLYDWRVSVSAEMIDKRNIDSVENLIRFREEKNRYPQDEIELKNVLGVNAKECFLGLCFHLRQYNHKDVLFKKYEYLLDENSNLTFCSFDERAGFVFMGCSWSTCITDTGLISERSLSCM